MVDYFGHFGFSYIGLIWMLMLFIPNFLWTKHQPKGYSIQRENKILVIFEKAGQASVTCTALIFSDYNIKSFSLWSLWLIFSFLFMVMYEIWWIRYFRSEKTLKDMYSSFLGLPAAGAALPVIAFLFLGIYGKVLWLIISVVILGIGHIGIHLQHLHQLNE